MRARRKALQVSDTVARERDPLRGFDNLLVPFGVLRVPPRWMFILSVLYMLTRMGKARDWGKGLRH